MPRDLTVLTFASATLLLTLALLAVAMTALRLRRLYRDAHDALTAERRRLDALRRTLERLGATVEYKRGGWRVSWPMRVHERGVP